MNDPLSPSSCRRRFARAPAQQDAAAGLLVAGARPARRHALRRAAGLAGSAKEERYNAPRPVRVYIEVNVLRTFDHFSYPFFFPTVLRARRNKLRKFVGLDMVLASAGVLTFRLPNLRQNSRSINVL